MREYLQVNPDLPDPRVVARAVREIRRGGVVAYPTDTLYGLAVDPMNAEAVSLLRRAKGRPSHLAIPLIAADLAQVLACAEDPRGLVRRLAGCWWPGPLTLVVQATAAFADGVRAGDGSLAIRVPDLAVARAMAEGLGRPITSTSANRTGESPPADPAHLAVELVANLALVLDGGATTTGPPSTIVDVRGDDLRLVRAGRVSWDRVLESAQ